MSEWHSSIIKKAISAGLEKFYNSKITYNTTILEFANSDCHRYKEDYYKEFEERRKIAPSEKYLIENWIKAIKKRGGHIEQRQGGIEQFIEKFSRGKSQIISDKILSSSYQAIIKGENPTIFRLLHSILYDPFDYNPNLGKADAELNYTNFLDEENFKNIVIGVTDAYFLADLEKGILPKLPEPSFYELLRENRDEKSLALAQEFFNVSQHFGQQRFSNELNERCAEIAYKTTGLLDFIKEFDFLKTYNPKGEIENSFDYENGLKSLITHFESLVGQDLSSGKLEDSSGLNVYYDSRDDSKIKYNEGFTAGIRGENLVFLPVVYSNKYADSITYSYFVYELVHGALIAYHLPKLKRELEQLQASNHVSPQMVHNASQNEKLNKAHLVRGLFEMLTAMGANHDRTTVAKLAFFLINGKEAANKKEYQTLLNAISAENKQPNNETAKAEKETIKCYLQTLNLLKEK